MGSGGEIVQPKRNYLFWPSGSVVNRGVWDRGYFFRFFRVAKKIECLGLVMHDRTPLNPSLYNVAIPASAVHTFAWVSCCNLDTTMFASVSRKPWVVNPHSPLLPSPRPSLHLGLFSHLCLLQIYALTPMELCALQGSINAEFRGKQSYEIEQCSFESFGSLGLWFFSGWGDSWLEWLEKFACGLWITPLMPLSVPSTPVNLFVLIAPYSWGLGWLQIVSGSVTFQRQSYLECMLIMNIGLCNRPTSSQPHQEIWWLPPLCSLQY